MTIKNGCVKITFVAENGTENYRTKAYFRGRRGGGTFLIGRKLEDLKINEMIEK